MQSEFGKFKNACLNKKVVSPYFKKCPQTGVFADVQEGNSRCEGQRSRMLGLPWCKVLCGADGGLCFGAGGYGRMREV